MPVNLGLDQDEVVATYRRLGSLAKTANALKCSAEAVRYHLKAAGEPRKPAGGRELWSPEEVDDMYVACGGNANVTEKVLGYKSRSDGGATVAAQLKRLNAYRTLQLRESVHIEVQDGTVLIGSDVHIWPDLITTGMAAFHHFVAIMNPAAVILNGDVIDGATISRFPDGWDHKPTVADEIAAAQAYLRGLVNVSPQARHIWPMGNHDDRFERKIKECTPELEGVYGTSLKDHFEDWEPCWACWINEGAGRSPVMVLHAYKGGQHAISNNTLWAGVHTVTGHLHNLNVVAMDDTWGTRYGVDSGMLASPRGPQFSHYLKGRPVNWRSGFVVLTFQDGKLLEPELVRVRDEEAGTVVFRGEVLSV